jgi:peroxiredoxin
MDMNKENQLTAWVDERLSSLNPDDIWQPNISAGLARLNEMRHKASWNPGRFVLAAATLATMCLLWVVLPSPKVLAHKCLECSVAVWESLASSGLAHTTLQPENGRKLAPDFNLKDSEGNQFTLSNLKGQVVLVNFWATWCEGCQIEIPWFIEFERKYAGQGLVVVGVSMDEDGWKSVKPWIKEKKVNYPIVIGDETLGKQYGLRGMPLTVLVDRNGKIADVHPGVVKRVDAEEHIRTLIHETAE